MVGPSLYAIAAEALSASQGDTEGQEECMHIHGSIFAHILFWSLPLALEEPRGGSGLLSRQIFLLRDDPALRELFKTLQRMAVYWTREGSISKASHTCRCMLVWGVEYELPYTYITEACSLLASLDNHAPFGNLFSLIPSSLAF